MDGIGKFFSSLSDGAPCFVIHDINANEINSNESANSFTNLVAPWAHLEDKHLLNILSYINYSDLLQCRLVSRYFRHVISKSELFLRSTILVNSFKPEHCTHPSILENTVIPFQSVRFESIDHDVFIGAKSEDRANENHNYNPPHLLLSNIKSIQFQNCYITWETIKRVVNASPKLEQLSVIRCHFVEKTTLSLLEEFEEFRVGRTFSSIKSVKILEHRNLKAVNILLEKLVGYCSHTLEDLAITFDPSIENDVIVKLCDMDSFCDLTRSILEANIHTLLRFNMDLKHQPLLNVFIPSVFGKMDSLWAELNLKEFALSPCMSATTPGCTPSADNIEISTNTISSAQILIGFLESQTQLKTVSLPHFRNIGGDQHYKWKLGRSLAPGIEYLCVPNQDYLPKEFLSRFSSLKKLYIGGSYGDNILPVDLCSEMFDQNMNLQPAEFPAHFALNLALSGSVYTFAPTSSTNETWDKFVELGIGSTIINGVELKKIIRKFHFLTKFEVTSQLAVMQDEDMQALIVGMPWLQSLNVAACDFLSDFGVTGIMRNSCKMMVRLQNYHDIRSSSVLNSRVNNGKPISQLKGLKSLILMGISEITDVGVHFGFKFQELETACLPYNKNITEWGIKKFGKHNPSLQVFVMSAVNQSSKDGLVHLQSNHRRIRQNKCTYLNYVMEEQLPVSKDVPQTSTGGFFSFPWFSTSTKAETEKQVEGVGKMSKDKDPIPSPCLPVISPPQKVEAIPKSALKVEKKPLKQVKHTRENTSKLPKPAAKPEVKAEVGKKPSAWKFD